MESLIGLKYLYLICEFMIKSSLVLGSSLLLFFLFKKKSASMRHFLLSFSLISLLLLPFLSTFITGWETRLLPSWQTLKNSPFDFDEGNQNKAGLYHINQKDTAVLATGTTPPSFENTKHQDKKTVSQKTIDKRTFLGLSLMTIWTVGLGFLLIRIILGLYGAHRLTRQGKRISGPYWHLLLQRFLEAVSIRRKISLLCHDQVRIPLTWGVFKPIVIMPAEAENWNRNECSSALFHELSHVKRSDFLFKILARFSCALYWFNPLSWFVFRLMRKEQEKACDELVLQAGIKPSTYAANLLSIQRAGQIQWNLPSTVLGAVGKSQLNERLMVILKQQLKPKEVKMKTKILLSVLVMAAITFIGLARPAQSAASNSAIFMDNAELMTEIQNSTQAESIQEEQEKKKTEKAEKKESTEKLDKKSEITWILKDGKKVHIIKAPEIHIKKAVKVPMSYAIQIEKGKKTLHIAPHGVVCAVPLLDIHPLIHLKTEHKKLQEKLEELRDKLKEIKELKGEVEKDEAREEALKAVEEVLEELNKKLEKKPKELEDLHIKINTDLKHKLVNKFKNLKTFKDHFVSVKVEGDKKIIGLVDKEGSFQIIIKNKLDSENKAKYEEILKKLKEELPEDYEVESEIDEEENTVTIKITTEKKDEKSKIEVKELVKKIVDELKKMEKK